VHRLVVALILALSPTQVAAQVLPTIGENADIRLWAPDRGIHGERARFLGWQDAALAFDRGTSLTPPPVTFAALERLDVLAGQSRLRGFARGLVIGALVGGTIGAVALSCEPNDNYCPLGRVYYFSIGGLVGGAVGGTVGTLFPMDRWERQELPPELGFPQ